MVPIDPVLLLHLTGDDRPGLLAELSAVLARHDVAVLDLNQHVIHRSVLIGLMVRGASAAAVSELDAAARAAGMALRVTPIADADYDAWVARQGAPRYICTLLARRLTAAHVSAVAALLAAQGLTIDAITRLSGRPPRTDDDRPRRACVELSVRGTPADEHALRAGLMDVTRHHPVDLAWQRDTVYRRMRRLVAFDMDSTLIRHEVIDELAREAGCGPAVAALTDAAMRGDLDFNESLTRRVRLLAGLDESALARVAARLDLTEGAAVLVAALRRFGYKTAILSGGFQYFGRVLQTRLGIDHLHANDLEITNGKLTGRVLGPVVNAARKADLLTEIAAAEHIALAQTVAVGDGANDLPMLAVAGLGIAFHAKPVVAAAAAHRITRLGLDGILYLIGVRDRDLLDDAAAA